MRKAPRQLNPTSSAGRPLPRTLPIIANALIAAFEHNGGDAIVRAADGDHRGNPVILPMRLAPAIQRLEGDVGARALIEESGLPVIDIDIGPAARIDVDTPEAVRAAGGRIERV